MFRKIQLILGFNLLAIAAFGQNAAQTFTYKNQNFEIKNVHASVINFRGEEVIKVERDLKAIPFDANRLEATVDEPTYVKLANSNFENGSIEVKVWSQIQDPSPFQFAQGFIGLAYRIDADDKAFESIYLRPKVGRSNNQLARNRAVQYYAYPDHKFQKLRQETPGMYEGGAPVDINEWITMRIDVQGEKAELFINDAQYSSFVVEKMKGKTTQGTIGLWVDIGTTGYFKDLKITTRHNPISDLVQDWERAKAYTKEYLDAMPDAKYALKPTREMRSFAEQMLHLTDANFSFGVAATGETSPIRFGELEKTADKSKANVTQLVLASYDFVINSLKKMNPDQLGDTIKLFGRFELTKGKALEKCFEHQTHHRGQTTVYLRLAGVTPPQEKLF